MALVLFMAERRVGISIVLGCEIIYLIDGDVWKQVI